MSLAADYPDWGSRVAVVGASRISFDVAIGAPQQSPITYMYDYEYVNIVVPDMAYNGHYGVTLTWYDAIDGLTEVASTGFVTAAAGFTAQKFPVVAPYLKLGVVNLDDTSGSNFVLDAYPSAISGRGLGASEDANPLIKFGANINAGATTTITAGTIYNGPAVLSVWQSNGHPWNAVVQYYDSAAKAYASLTQINSASGASGQAISLMLPRTQVALQLTNSDTSTRFLNASLCTGGG